MVLSAYQHSSSHAASSASKDNGGPDPVIRNRQLQDQVDTLQHRVRELEAKLRVFVTSAAAALQTSSDTVAATSSATLSAFSVSIAKSAHS